MRKAISNSRRVQPDHGAYVPDMAACSLSQIASAPAPFLKATLRILETPAILFFETIMTTRW